MLHGTSLEECVAQAIGAAGGWIGFDRFMALALYTPGLGYYAGDLPKFGALPGSGSDFVTAPEMTPLFGQTLAVQVAEALQRTGTREVWEFGAGSGALALQLLDALGDAVQRYTIVDLSGSLRARQQALLAVHAGKVRWVDALPERMDGVVVGNELLDAMPVKLLARHGGAQGADGELGGHPPIDRVADDPVAEQVLDRAAVDLALASGVLGDVSDPDQVRRLNVELLLQTIRGGDRRFAIMAFAAAVASLRTQAFCAHQAIDAVLAAALAQVAQIVADLAIAIDPSALEPGLMHQRAHASVVLAAQ